MLKSVFHTSWTVENLGRSIAFYRDFLGFELIGTRDRQGIEIETVVGFAKADLHIAFLRLPGVPVGISGHHLELIEYRHPRGVKLDIMTCDTGSAHLALETDSIHDDYQRLRQAGVKIVSEPVVFKGGVAGEVLAFYLRDPDGFTIELVQLATPPN
jgi:catechol 2,3-dioxygenase-like lactoylglutathione lyase family enzyme